MDEYAEEVKFRVLGPIQAIRDDIALPIGGPKQRLVLALLLVDAPNAVPTGRLIDGVWGEDPPETARKTVQGYVHHLRSQVGEALATDPSGYRLEVEPTSIDAVAFEAAVRDATQRATDSAHAAAEKLRDALAMWRGNPYADLDGVLALEPEISRLNELRVSAIEERLTVDLLIGVDGLLVGELESLVHEHPLRERLRGLHMRALYMSGRQAEALRAFDRTRVFLGQELGLEPSRELRDLEERILNDDLEIPESAGAPPTVGRGIRGYEVRETIGSGALGAVHRVYQTSVGREVALKTLRGKVADDPRFIERFEDESRRVGSLQHEHIVPLLDTWREPGAAYQVRPWFDAGNLYTKMAGGPMPLAAALRVLDEVGQALSYAHRRGFSHCRVKPANVLFDRDGRALLTDFAIAAAETPTGGPEDDAYLAPELRAVRGPAGPATDVFSLGVMARCLLTVGRAELDSPPELSDRLKGEFEDVLAQACHANPSQRFPRIDDLIRALKQAAGVDVTQPAVSTVRTESSEIRNPYKGLRAFQEEDAGDFFGREELVGRLLSALDERDFVAVIGPSGIGKSSVVKAGLIPELRKRRTPTDSPFLVTEMFPGTHPFEELSTALLKVAVDRPLGIVAELMSDERGLQRVAKQVLPDDGSELLLVIDQFEELFTLAADESRRRLFLDSLRAAAENEHSRIRVIVTMRADFYDRPLEYFEFGELLEAGAVTVLVPSRDGLAQAVSEPARAVGLDLEPGLVAEVVRDVMDQPGALPLMQYALTELFEQRTADTLTLEAYRETGGVLGALGTRAEGLWKSLSPAGHEAIRQTFLRLVTVDESADDMRRRVRRSELSALGLSQRELNEAITLYGAHRLLTFDRDPITRGPTVEVAHEALLREWERLRGWIETQREDLVLHRLLATELGEWEAASRERSYLLRGGRLAQFELWEATTTISLTRAEQEFLEASRSLREDEEAKERRTQRRLRSMLVGVSVLAAVALIAGAVAASQANHAEANATEADIAREAAETRRLALQAPQLVDTNRQVSLLLAVEALRRERSDPANLGALQDVFVNTGNFLGYVVTDRPPLGVGFTSADDPVVLSGTEIVVFDAVTGRRSRVIDARGSERIAVAAMASRVAVARGPIVKVYEVLEQQEIEVIDTGRSPITALEFDRSGRLLGIGFEDGTAMVRDLDRQVTITISGAHEERSFEDIDVPPHLPDEALFGTRVLAFSDDGSRLATGGLVHARVWDLTQADTPEIFGVVHMRSIPDGRRIPEAVRALRFSPQSATRLFVASSINVAEYDIDDNARNDDQYELEFPDRVGAIANFAEDEEIALTDTAAILAEGGGRVVVLPLDGGPIQQFDTHQSGGPHIGVAADGRTVAIANGPGLSIWSTAGQRLVASSIPRGQASEAIPSFDGEWVALNTPVGVVIEMYQRVDKEYVKFEMPLDGISSAHPGRGSSLVTWSLDDGATRLWDMSERPLQNQLLAKGDSIYSFAYSADGRFFASGTTTDTSKDDGAVVHVFDLATGAPVRAPLTDLVEYVESRSSVLSLSFSPDGAHLVGVNSFGKAVIWDTADWSPRGLAQGGGQVALAEYSLDGRFLVTTASNGTTDLRDPTTLAQVGGRLIGQTSGIEGISAGPAFTPDGKYMLTTADGTGRVWDLDTYSQVGTGFPSLPNTGTNVSRDGRWMATFAEDEVIVWDLDFNSWIDVACRAAGRNLTLDEWEQFAPAGEEYRATCEMWPAARERDPS